jgi:hypothetical protein
LSSAFRIRDTERDGAVEERCFFSPPWMTGRRLASAWLGTLRIPLDEGRMLSGPVLGLEAVSTSSLAINVNDFVRILDAKKTGPILINYYFFY